MQRLALALTALLLPVLANSQEWTVTTLGGRAGSGWYDGKGRDAAFNSPIDLVVDANGNVYVADNGNHMIRKITPDGEVYTVAGFPGRLGGSDGTRGAAEFDAPFALIIDPGGNLLLAEQFNFGTSSQNDDGQRFRKITPAGVVTTLDYGVSPHDMAYDSSGNLYVADGIAADSIFKIAPNGTKTLITDCIGTGGGMCPPCTGRVTSLGVDPGGNVYYAWHNNGCEFNGVVKLSPGGVTTTIGVTDAGYADGTTEAMFENPSGMAFDAAGNVYVADTGNAAIRKITPAGVVTTVAGSYRLSYGRRIPIFGDDDGPAASATFAFPTGVAIGSDGSVYVADPGSHSIRKITPSGTVTTLAGHGAIAGTTDGPIATTGKFRDPVSIASDGVSIYVLEGMPSYVLRKIAADGTVSTVAGQRDQHVFGDDPSLFGFPSRVAVDRDGNVVVLDGSAIRRVSPSGLLQTIAGTVMDGGAVDGSGTAARFRSPGGMAFDSANNLYVADSGNHTIRKISPAGIVTTVAGAADQSGTNDGPVSTARFKAPADVGVDAQGNLYVLEYQDGPYVIRKISAAGAVTTLAVPVSSGHGIAVDDAGNLFILELTKVVKVTPAGVVSTIAGSDTYEEFEDGTGSAAKFKEIQALTVDRNGRLLVIDSRSADARLSFDANATSRIRVGVPSISDRGTISPTTVNRNSTAQFDTTPQTATSWKWSFVHRSVGATAQFSSATVRNPTLVPNFADYYLVQLEASNSSGSRISRVGFNVSAVCAPLASVAASVAGATNICDRGLGGTASAIANGGGAVSYQWGWRGTSSGTITNITGATASTYAIRGSDFGRTGTVYLVCTITPECGSAMTTNEVSVTLDASLCGTLKGDANGDNAVSAADVMHLLAYLFGSGSAPIGPCDVNADGVINVKDVFYLLNYLFAGGPAPS